MTKRKHIAQYRHCKDIHDLAYLLHLSVNKLSKTLENSSYTQFYLTNHKGKKRLIQAPDDALAEVQRRVATQFNTEYADLLPDAVHGYIPRSITKSGKPRDIISNATYHLHTKYLINVDLKDFFPSIGKNHLDSILKSYLKIPKKTRHLLASMCLYDEALPTGSPSSPVLSNIVSIPMDLALQVYCKQAKVRYTRYVDDMSFSSTREFSSNFLRDIKMIIEQAGFEVNKKKIQNYGKSDKKIVTGIVLTKRGLKVSNSAKRKLSDEIQQYQQLTQTYHNIKMLGNYNDDYATRYRKYQQAIKGKLNYLKRIDKKDATYLSLKQQYESTDDQLHYIDEHIYF